MCFFFLNSESCTPFLPAPISLSLSTLSSLPLCSSLCIRKHHLLKMHRQKKREHNTDREMRKQRLAPRQYAPTTCTSKPVCIGDQALRQIPTVPLFLFFLCFLQKDRSKAPKNPETTVVHPPSVSQTTLNVVEITSQNQYLHHRPKSPS